MSGTTYKCKSLGEIIGFCPEAEDACRKLKSYLDVARSFGGEEVIEIKAAGNQDEGE
jgi:hypothetical protein